MDNGGMVLHIRHVRRNAQSIFALNTGKDPLSVDSLSFGLDIVDALVKAFITSRKLHGLQTPTIKKMEYLIKN